MVDGSYPPAVNSPDPVTDRHRLAVVGSLRLIDTPREPVFEEIARVVARLLDAPFAFVTVVDDLRSFWKAAYGVNDGTRSNTVAESFCQYVIRSRAELLVDDAAVHPITRQNPSIDSMGVRAWAGAPIVIDDQVVGSFCVVDTVPRQWTDSDREVLDAFRDQVEREFELHRILQDERSERELATQSLADLRAELVPVEPPAIPGLDVAGWHRAATDGNDVLGDFYDVFRIGEHRWGIVLGDVCGHGPAAARLTGLVRYTLRAATAHHDDPADAFVELDAVVQRDHVDPGRFATVSYVGVDTTEPGTIRRASAGHPPPIVRRSDGTIDRLTGARGGPIGLAHTSAYLSEQVSFDPGSIVLLYSDGATDARDHNGDPLGDDPLDALAAAAPTQSAREFVDFVAEGILAHATDDLLDDVALVAVRFPTASD